MEELSNGVAVLLGRMESNPEEFYGESPKWRFIFSEKFRDVLTEAEKGMIHGAMKQLRRTEFDATVVGTIMKISEEEDFKKTRAGPLVRNQTSNKDVFVDTSNASVFVGSSNTSITEQLIQSREARVRIEKELEQERRRVFGNSTFGNSWL